MKKRLAKIGGHGRPATGSIRWKRNPATGAFQWFARLTLVDGSRPIVGLDPSLGREDEAAARDCARAVSERARGARAVSVRNVETVAEYSDRWLAYRLERGLVTVDDDRSRLRKHILPVLGSYNVQTVSRDDVERLVERLDETVRTGLSWKTAAHCWGLVTKMFSDACGSKRRDLRVRDDNPARGVHGPDRGVSRTKVYLYPSEFSALVACEAVPLRWRRMFAVTTYLYARAGEVNALVWGDVDLERGVVHIHASASRTTGSVSTTKSGKSRRVPIERELMPLLRAMHCEERERSGEMVAMARVSSMAVTDRKLSRQLRRCLELSGVTRPDLFADDESRKCITFHDLRSTGITWCALRGDDPLRIKQRAGHAGFATTEGYIREAENLRETNFGTPFPPLPLSLITASEELPEAFGTVSAQSRNEVHKISKLKEKGWRRRESNPGPKMPRPLASTCVSSRLCRPDLRRLASSPQDYSPVESCRRSGDPSLGQPVCSRSSQGTGKPLGRPALRPAY